MVLEMRTIDFVIKDRSQMFGFLRILLTYLKHFEQTKEIKDKIRSLKSKHWNPFKRLIELDQLTPEERYIMD